jgi:hypothetical protein
MAAAAASPAIFRGVLCRHCGKAVRVPGIVLRKDNESHGQHDANDDHFHLISRVFVLRCRSCEREAIYSISQIVDCAFNQPTPESKLERAIL